MTKMVAEHSGGARVALHIAVYNTRNYVEAAVRSVLAQTCRDFKLTLWDDGSTDGSAELLQKLAETDARVRVVNGTHAGVAAAHEAAIAASAGEEFIGWIDSDDVLAPTALAETVAALDQNPRAGFVYTDYFDMDEPGKQTRVGLRCKIPFSPERLLVDFMTFHFRLLRRSVYDAAGGMQSPIQSGAEDYDLCLRMSEQADVIHVPRPLYYYRQRPESFSNKNRLDQINASLDTVRRALVRRGMEKDHDLSLELIAKVILKRKDGASVDSPTVTPASSLPPAAAPGALNVAVRRRPNLNTNGNANSHKSAQIQRLKR